MMLGAIVQRGWSKLPRNAPRVVSIMLGTLVAAELGRTALVLSPLIGVGSLEAKSGTAEGLHKQIRPGRVDPGKIIEAHLFGDLAKNIPAASDADAPPTSASLRLTGTKDRSAFTDAGLHGGDLVVAVNGVSVLEQNRRDGREAFNAVGNADRATMTIERFGRTTDVTIDVAQAGTSAGAAATNVVEDATSVP